MFTKDLFHFSADAANHDRGLEHTADETKVSEARHCVHRKLFGGTFAKNEKDKLKNIREDEGETPLSDAGIDVDVLRRAIERDSKLSWWRHAGVKANG